LEDRSPLLRRYVVKAHAEHFLRAILNGRVTIRWDSFTSKAQPTTGNSASSPLMMSQAA
jgi:hypothetical protein